jgi:hypothetical protein
MNAGWRDHAIQSEHILLAFFYQTNKKRKNKELLPDWKDMKAIELFFPIYFFF